MSNAASSCPPADVIAAFAFGHLQADSVSGIQQHLSECDVCLETVGHLAAPEGPESAESVFCEAGRIIGPYRLARRLGEGGMGEVWEAEQLSPVRRTVALKLLKAGMDSRQIAMRFEAERQVLALMQHPGIAQMFDAGITAGGRSYFVMEYVEGSPITSYCDKAGINVQARLLLFQQVCDAVQHAHQKGVIHRDIKPSNVLVTLKDGVPLPKVIDFGLAKLTAPDAGNATLTEIGTILGTPAYASPEQMSLGTIDVDTRSDVYSLGVMLYELLIGVIPFETDDPRPVALLELRRNIRDLEPARPSARLSSLGDRRETIAQMRASEVSALRRQLRGDLDWIVMKALEKDRMRRYASPEDFRRDIERYLEHEPVLARSPTASYRLHKFVQRHRLGTAFATALLLLLIAFAAISAVQARRIAAERDRATAEASKASSINTFLQETIGSADPWQTGTDISIRQTLEQAAKKVDIRFKDQPLVAAGVRRTIGESYAGLGRFDEAERLLRSALEVRVALLGREHADVAQSLSDMAALNQQRGNYDLAETQYREVLAIRRKLFGAVHALVADSLLDLATVLTLKGEFASAYEAAAQALSIREQLTGKNGIETAAVLTKMGEIVSGQGDFRRAEQFSARAFDLYKQRLGSNDVRTALAASNLGAVYYRQDKYEQAETLYRNSVDALARVLGRSHPETIISMENLAGALLALKRYDEALLLMDEVLAARRAVLGEENRLVARTLINIATVLSRAGKIQQAREAYAAALPRFVKAYGPDHPDTALSYYAFGVFESRQHEYAQAEKLLRQALAIQLKRLPENHPGIADTRLSLGEVLIEKQQYAEAEQLLVQAREVMEKTYGAAASETKDALAALERVSAARPSGR